MLDRKKIPKYIFKKEFNLMFTSLLLKVMSRVLQLKLVRKSGILYLCIFLTVFSW